MIFKQSFPTETKHKREQIKKRKFFARSGNSLHYHEPKMWSNALESPFSKY